MADRHEGWTRWGGSRLSRPALAGWFWLASLAPMAATCGEAAAADAPASAPAKPKEPPTYTRDVAPILQKRCQNCHRRHHVGPFALETYEQARKRAADIALVAGDRVMPPWKPAPGVGPKLKHDQSLTPAEIAILAAWAEAGAPQGDARHMPPPAQFAVDWKLGTPDLILEADEDFEVPDSGPDVYRCFVVPTNLTRETFITAVDFRPGNRRVVHHVSAYIDVSGAARERDKAEKGPGYVSFSGPGIPAFEELCFWNAGHEPSHLPEGVGLRVPPQADIIIQVHYHPSGKPEADRTRLGFYFAREPIKQVLHWNQASNFEFRLPAGKDNIEVVGSWFVPADVEALAVSPHMHYLGRDMRMYVKYPNGKTLDLIHIPDWDPAWQNTYYFHQPIAIPKGSLVKVVAHFDNSAHARNPSQPPKAVKWGPSVDDEMCDGFIAVVKKGQDLIRHPGIDDLGELFARQRIRNAQRQMANPPR
jgi:hypothetical protein